jgi:hypothetical protein
VGGGGARKSNTPLAAGNTPKHHDNLVDTVLFDLKITQNHVFSIKTRYNSNTFCEKIIVGKKYLSFRQFGT